MAKILVLIAIFMSLGAAWAQSGFSLSPIGGFAGHLADGLSSPAFLANSTIMGVPAARLLSFTAAIVLAVLSNMRRRRC